MFRFTIRDLMWMMVVVGLIVFLAIDSIFDAQFGQRLVKELEKTERENQQLRQVIEGYKEGK